MGQARGRLQSGISATSAGSKGGKEEQDGTESLFSKMTLQEKNPFKAPKSKWKKA